jgi:pimeloyl-ACP methyl ester carboxylesterase
MSEGFAEVNGARIWYEDAGEGPPVLLLHGHLIDSGQWDTQMPAFTREHRVVRFDGRGMGRSSLPEGGFSHAEDLAGLMDHLGIERAALVGCSGGGATCLELALMRPGAVQALVLVGSGLPGHPQGEPPPVAAEVLAALQRGDVDAAAEGALRWWMDGDRARERVDPVARERTREMMTRRFRLPYGEDRARRLAPPAAERLGEIAAPVLIVVGADDYAPIREIAERLEREVPGARRLVVPDSGHHPNMEHPEEFNRAMLDFLRSVRVGGR